MYPIEGKISSASAPVCNQVTIDLGYLSPDQALKLVAMFDSQENYVENFSSIKAIASILHKLLESGRYSTSMVRMFAAVNKLQHILQLEDEQEWRRLYNASGIISTHWPGMDLPVLDIDQGFT